MKKKILNALLMGVLVMTSMSVFVSCKDYDDDIDDLRVEQADLLSQLTSLQSDVQSQTLSITSQITSLQSSVSSLSTELQTAISDAASAAQSAGAAATAAATAQSTADNAADAAAAAQATADEALAKAQEALTKASDTAAGEALDKITELSNKLGSLETLDNGIAGLVEQVNKAATKEELKEVEKSVSKYQNYFNSLFAMVTSVELYGSFSGSETTVEKVKNSWDMNLLHGYVGENSTFGDDEAYAASDPTHDYVKGADIIQKNTGIIVRVNPVNADLSANGKILLVNSKGESLEDYVEVASVEPYDDLITTTRATSINSGLWKVAFQFKEKVDIDAFKDAVINGTTKVENPDGSTTTKDKYVLFAVAVNNTDTVSAADAKDKRYVASTYDLTLDKEKYTPASKLDYKVTNSRGTTYVTSKDGKFGNDTETYTVIGNRYGEADGVTEYTWSGDPATKKVTTSGSANVTADVTNDNRANGTLLPVEQGSEFTIELSNTPDKIDYYYVTLDKDYAVEGSAPSEWAAWSSYKYDGKLLKTVKASEKLTLKVTSDINLAGEEIGFRVYAVNYDGTLVDPDGKAFYVVVGKAAGEQEGSGNITASETTANNYTDIELTGTFNSFAKHFSETLVIDDEKSDAHDAAGKITYQLLDGNKKAIAADNENNWNKAKYVRVYFNHPGYFEDGGTFVAHTDDDIMKDDKGNVVNTLTVTVTKVMPTGAPDLSFKAGQLKDGVYKCYLTPANWNNKDNTTGSMNLTNFVNGLGTYTVATNGTINDDTKDGFTWIFDEAKTVDNKKDSINVLSPYNVKVNKSFINNDTQHATSVTYTYAGISYKKVNGNWTALQNYTVPSDLTCNTIFCCPLDEDVLELSWDKGMTSVASGTTAAVYKDVNYIVYGDDTPAKGLQVFEGSPATKVDVVLEKYILADNDFDNTLYGGTWSSVCGKFLADNDNKITAKLTSVDGGKVDYYNVTWDTTDKKFKFEVLSGSSNPVEDVPSKLTITAKDAFGHTHTWTLDFTVKRR